MEAGRGLESSFINPLKLCSQHFKKVYVLLWITIMLTNAGAQRVCDHSLFSRQYFTRTFPGNNPHIFKIKWVRKMKCKTLDKDKSCNKSCLRFSYCVLWLCCLRKHRFLFVLWYGHLILAKLNEQGEELGEKITDKILVQIRVTYSGEATGKHQPVSKTVFMDLDHLCCLQVLKQLGGGVARLPCEFWSSSSQLLNLGGLLIMVWPKSPVLSFHLHLLWCITCCSLWMGCRVDTCIIYISQGCLL